MDWLKGITTEDLYKFRDVLDNLEKVKEELDPTITVDRYGICLVLRLEDLHSCLEPFQEFFYQQTLDYFQDYNLTYDAYWFQDWHTRGIVAGFICCWIDDELISRGE